MKKAKGAVYYADYLQLDKLLSSQRLMSEEYGRPAHDEMLFIVIHQVYELWFKQVIHELGSVLNAFGKEKVVEADIGRCVGHLTRICKIQKIMVEQLDVLETMTPLDFLDFRDFLIPASGFQSFQFRIVEIMLGVRNELRPAGGHGAMMARLSDEHRKLIERWEAQPSLRQLVERWLERTPFLDGGEYDFMKSYRAAVNDLLSGERRLIETNPILSKEEITAQLGEHEGTAANFASLFDERQHGEMVKRGERHFSHRATCAALFIHLYRDQPLLHLPFRLLSLLVDVDELLTAWRHRHSMMVHRMIGTKIGTGGSSGYHYLKSTLEKGRIFSDLSNLSTFLIPRSALPQLPEAVEKRLGFAYGGA